MLRMERKQVEHDWTSQHSFAFHEELIGLHLYLLSVFLCTLAVFSPVLLLNVLQTREAYAAVCIWLTELAVQFITW